MRLRTSIKCLLFLSLIMFIGSCKFFDHPTQKISAMQFSYFDDNGKLLSKGLLTSDSLQIGSWVIYKNGLVTENGSFLEGLKYGRWSYNYEDFRGTIDWDTTTTFNNLRINYPNDFLYVSKDTVLRLLASDSLVEITIGLKDINTDISDIQPEIEHYFGTNGFSISKLACTKILYKDKYSYSLFYDIYKDKQLGLDYNTFVHSGQKYFWIRMQCQHLDKHNYQYYMILYLTIIENLFIDHQKLIDPYKLIESKC